MLLSWTGCPAKPNQPLRPAEGRTADGKKTKAPSDFPETDQSFARFALPHQALRPVEGRPADSEKNKSTIAFP